MKFTTVAVLGLLLVTAACLPAAEAQKPSKPTKSSGSTTSTSAVVRASHSCA